MDNLKFGEGIDPQVLAWLLLQRQGISRPQPVGLPPRVGADYIFAPRKDITNSTGHKLGTVSGVEDPIDMDAGLRGERMDSVLGGMMDNSRNNVSDYQQRSRELLRRMQRTRR